MAQELVCVKCGHRAEPKRVPAVRKNPAIGMTIAAFALLGICGVIAESTGHSKDMAAGCGGLLGGGCLAVLFFIIGVVCLVIAIGKAASNSRLTDTSVCAVCGSLDLIPPDSENAKKLSQESTKEISKETKTENTTTKQCPFCAETIQQAAIVCRYCGRDLPKQESDQATVIQP